MLCFRIIKTEMINMSMFENDNFDITALHTVVYGKSKLEKLKNGVVSYNSHIHTNELVFFVSGERITRFDGKAVEDIPNSVRLLPMGKYEGDYTVEVLSESECIYIWFDSDKKVGDTISSLKNMNELKPLFFRIYNVWNAKAPGFYSKSMSILYEIISVIKCSTDKYLSSINATKLKPSLDYMRSEYLNPNFNYKAMCEKSGLSYDYFKELFIKLHGVSPVKYVTALRMEKAKELLATGMYSVTEISEMCGYDNVYYFSKVFKTYTGVTPKSILASR